MKKIVLAYMIGLSILMTNVFAASTNGSNNGKLYNTAYFDVVLKSQGPMLDYIKYSKRASFDTKQFLGTINKIKENNIVVKVHGRIEIPKHIITPQVYVTVGTSYYEDIYGGNRATKEVFYNNSKDKQQAEYYLTDTKNDKFGNRYIEYKFLMNYSKPYNMESKSVALPNNVKFMVAPKSRGFKSKFQSAEIYVFEE